MMPPWTVPYFFVPSVAWWLLIISVCSPTDTILNLYFILSPKFNSLHSPKPCALQQVAPSHDPSLTFNRTYKMTLFQFQIPLNEITPSIIIIIHYNNMWHRPTTQDSHAKELKGAELPLYPIFIIIIIVADFQDDWVCSRMLLRPFSINIIILSFTFTFRFFQLFFIIFGPLSP